MISHHHIDVIDGKVHQLGADLSRTAVVVVDMQRMFLEEDFFQAAVFAKGVVEPIRRLTREVRARGGLVVWTRQTADPNGQHRLPEWLINRLKGPGGQALLSVAEGDPLHEIAEELDVDPADIVINKYRPSAFLPDVAGLHPLLKARGIENVIIVGTVTNMCCQSTARDAMMLDYKVFFVADATAAGSDEAHNATLRDLRGMGFFDLRPSEDLIREMSIS